MAVSKERYVLSIAGPKLVITGTIAKLMPLAINAYSIAVAPSVELRKRFAKFFSFVIGSTFSGTNFIVELDDKPQSLANC
jgi:hypothetical protein